MSEYKDGRGDYYLAAGMTTQDETGLRAARRAVEQWLSQWGIHNDGEILGLLDAMEHAAVLQTTAAYSDGFHAALAANPASAGEHCEGCDNVDLPYRCPGVAAANPAPVGLDAIRDYIYVHLHEPYHRQGDGCWDAAQAAMDERRYVEKQIEAIRNAVRLFLRRSS